MRRPRFSSIINYDKDFYWLENNKEIIVSSTALSKTTDLAQLGETSRKLYCEKVIYLYFLMVFSSPYIFPKMNSSSFYLDKQKKQLHWYPGNFKLKLKNKSQMQLANVYKSLYIDSKTTDLDVGGFFWNKPKDKDVFDRLVRLHMRSHFSGPIDFSFQGEILNTCRTISFLTINRLIPSLDLFKFTRLLINIHLILMKSGVSINFKPIAQKAFSMSQKKIMS